MDVCCVIGHRDIPPDRIAYVEQKLGAQIDLALEEGYNRFVVGFALGVDMLFVHLLQEKITNHPGILIEAVLPYAGAMKRRKSEERQLLSTCDSVSFHTERYTPGCVDGRNRFLIDQSHRIIAVYDGRLKGHTHSALRYAAATKKDIRLINIV